MLALDSLFKATMLSLSIELNGAGGNLYNRNLALYNDRATFVTLFTRFLEKLLMSHVLASGGS